MSGINRQISGEVTKSKKKGKALVSAIGSAFSPSAIAAAKPKTQKCK